MKRQVSQAKDLPLKLPTRLVYIGEAQGELAPKLVLTPASATLETLPYFTLSHSWSITTKGTSLKLTTENLQKLQEAIPLVDLPQTFRDAMDITHRLGYRYIWIDSLCIIQDSRGDWENEAVTMCDVYGNSTCTITALGTGAMDRCYVQRNPLSLFPCRVNLAQGLTPVYAMSSDMDWDFDLPDKDSHIFRRGWVMQERLLSPRVLFTGQHQFHWECCHLRTNEAFTFAFGSGPVIAQSPKLAFHAMCDLQFCTTDRYSLADGADVHLTRNMLKWYPVWTKLLSDYTRMKLTYHSDKLMALAGIFDAVQASRGWTNVAGIWKEFWYLELLWEFDVEDGQRSSTRTGSMFPSWSWAATVQPKKFYNTIKLLEGPGEYPICSCLIDPLSGPINGGDFRPFCAAQIIGFSGIPSGSQHPPINADPNVVLTIKGPIWAGFASVSSNPSDKAKIEAHFRFKKVSFDEILPKSQVVYFLPLLFSHNTNKLQDYPTGLILAPVPVKDAVDVEYWPPAPRQADLDGKEKRGEDGRAVSNMVEPTHYRRIGLFWLGLGNMGLWANPNYERTIHII